MKGFRPWHGLAAFGVAVVCSGLYLLAEFGLVHGFWGNLLNSSQLLVFTIVTCSILRLCILTGGLFILPAGKSSAGGFMAIGMLAGFASICVVIFRMPVGSQRAFSFGFWTLTDRCMEIFSGGLCGLFVYSVKAWNRFRRQKLDPEKVPVLWGSLVLALVLDGVYIYFSGLDSGFQYLSVAPVLFAALECRIQYRELGASCSYPDHQQSGSV